MKLRRVLALLLIAVSLLNLQSCKMFEKSPAADVKYRKFNDNFCSAYDLTKKGEKKEVVYVLDEYKGAQVTNLGRVRLVAEAAHFGGENVKKIYLPWSITSIYKECLYGIKTRYVISASNSMVPATVRGSSDLVYDGNYRNLTFVIPLYAYEEISAKGRLRRLTDTGGYYDVYEELYEKCIPANIAYFFNYEDSPNAGYFFVDLLEETGKLTKPPYDPKREGYEFAGWYTDKECTKRFNFFIDNVTIYYDEEGNRIYEEFCLYAKWDKK